VSLGMRVGRNRASADEKQHLPAVGDEQSRQKLAVQRTYRDGRVGPHEFTDVLKHGLETGREMRPAPLNQGDQRVADAGGQALFGHRTSVTTATSMPAMAPATPFLAASLENTREKNEGEAGFDMSETSMEVESSMVLIPLGRRELLDGRSADAKPAVRDPGTECDER